MRLCNHPDFKQAIIQATSYFSAKGLRESFIEKDYFVTEILRTIANSVGDKIIFKGGTSLSKGWDLIERFSEDIDLFLDPNAYSPMLSKKQIDRELRKLRDHILKDKVFTFLPEESQTIGGFGRSDRFSYNQLFGGIGEIANKVLIEIGTASGKEPAIIVEIKSYLAQYLKAKNLSLGSEDEESFSFKLLHFRRTFVEKLFAIHSKVELFKQNNKQIGSYARHYYDLSQLISKLEVLNMLKSDEYDKIKKDYHKISLNHFSRDYFSPRDMRFSNSDAIFPTESLRAILGKQYEEQCRFLCYGKYPSWETVLKRFEELKEYL